MTPPRPRRRSALVAAVAAFLFVAAAGAASALPTGSTSPLRTVPLAAAHTQDPDTRSLTVGVKFVPKVDGLVMGVEFERTSTANTGRAVQLWSAGGQLLASSNRIPVGTGDVHQWFDEPVAVTAGTTYVASYLAPAGRYSAARGWFTQARANDALTAPVNAGVYRYGTAAAFPDQTYNGSDYGVSPVFVANLGAATTPPPPPPPVKAACEDGVDNDGDGKVDHPADPGCTSLTDGDEVDPAAPPPPAPAGWFSVNGSGQIIDPAGKPFVPVGVNANGPNWVWQDPTIGQSAAMTAWGFNTLRVNACITRCDPTWAWPTNNDLDALVAEYTGKGHVIMIAQHQYGGDQWQGREAELADWWKATAARYKDNPRVWFNLINEPTTAAESAAVADRARWDALHRTLAAAVRGVAPRNIIVMDGNHYGQDRGTWNCLVGSPLAPGQPNYGGSAIVNEGPAMARDFGPVVFATHFYGSWGGNEAGGCGPAQWDAVMAHYVDTVHGKGLALVAGEFGSSATKAAEEWFAAGAYEAGHAMFRVLPGKGVGALAWHGSAGTHFNLYAPARNWTDGPTAGTLSWMGVGMRDRY